MYQPATLSTLIIICLININIAKAQSLQTVRKTTDAIIAEIMVLQDKLDTLEKTMQGQNDLKIKWEPAPSFKNTNKRFEMNLRGRVFTDAAWLSDKNDNINVKATELRAARLGIEGKAWNNTKYKFESDFSGNKTTVKDAYLQWKVKTGASITVGQFKTPNSLDEQTSSRYITFMERASFTDAFELARKIGVGVSTGGYNWTAKAGVFRGSNGSSLEDEGSEFAARVTYSPTYSNTQLHFGGSARYRTTGDQSKFRYRQRPHQHLSPKRFVETNRIGSKDFLVGLEAASLNGPIWVTAEIMRLKPKVGLSNQGNPAFFGGYAEAGYFITGEKRGYKASKGAWDRPKVINPVNDGGTGAWALATRFDLIDLSSKGYLGGKQENIIVGLNWYLNRYTRIMVNYNNTKINNASPTSINGNDGSNSINGIGLRAQIDW